VLGPEQTPDRHQWLITATTPDGRFAYLGFTGVWFPRHREREHNQTRPILITDRPVYRPKQSVQFKFWVRHAKYDREDTSDFANRAFTVRINNPKGEKVFEKAYKADEYGGIDGEFALPKDATLGMYYIRLVGIGGGGTAGSKGDSAGPLGTGTRTACLQKGQRTSAPAWPSGA